MTLKEIAKEANVSISTVSRVINQENTKAASPEVQARIWEIVRRTGYSPNKTARSLKLGQTPEVPESVSKSITCIYARPHTDMSDPFFHRLPKRLNLKPSRAGISSVIPIHLRISRGPKSPDSCHSFHPMASSFLDDMIRK